jgi:hypothetical protein
MAEKNIEREAVQNPFDMGPNTSFQQPARQMKQMINKPRSAFQASNDGMAIVDALLNFAEVCGGIYTTQMSKKIAADKITQSAQAELKLAPTSEATVAGYRAHAATMMKDKVTQQRAKLSDLAKKGLTKEEWIEAVRKSYSEVDDYLSANYSNYHTDKEMQKLLPLAFREMMPQLNTLRESENIKIMTDKGKDAVTDQIITQSKLLNENGISLTPDQLSTMFTNNLKALRLTTDEKDSIVENVVLLSKDRNMLEAAKQWKGDRKSNLFERSGKLQMLDKQLKDKEIVSKGVDYEVAQAGLQSQAIQGAITKDQFISQVKLMRKQSNDTYPYRGFVQATLAKIDKQRLADADMSASMEAFMSGNTYKLKDKKPKDLEAIYDKLSSTLGGAAIDEAKAELPGADDAAVQELASKKYIAKSQMLIQRSVEQGHIPKSLKNRLNQVAVINVAEEIKDQERKGGGIQEKLDPSIEKELQFVNSVPVASRQAILEDMTGTNKDVIEAYWNEMKKGVSPALALDRAQRKANNPPAVKTKAINEAADKIVSNLEWGFPWLGGGQDYTDNQKGLVKKYVANLLFNSFDPLGESTQEHVENAVKSYARTGNGRVFLGMTPDKLYEMTKVDISHVDSGLDALISENMDRLKPTLDTMGIEQKDVTIMPYPEQGYFRLVDSTGALLTTKRFKFSEIGDAANRISLKRQKEMLSWKKEMDIAGDAMKHRKGLFE